MRKGRHDSDKLQTAIRLCQHSIINPVSQCWLWTGAIINSGYGVIGITIGGKKGNRLVHRASMWAFKDFDILNTLQVLHRCDIKECFNPDHLFIGTQLDNIRDCWHKGRRTNAMQRHPRKLTADKVLYIRSAYAKGGYTTRSLAAKMGLGKSTVEAIVNKRIWRHVCS
jgi:Autographiviridae endonuclease